MITTCDGLPLKEVEDPIVKEIRLNKLLSRYLENLLWPIGNAKVVGSCKRRVSYKDIDVVVDTHIKTEKTIVRFIQDQVLSSWSNISDLHIDLFVSGEFPEHIVCGHKYTIYFSTKRGQKWNYLKIMTRKFMRYLLWS